MMEYFKIRVGQVAIYRESDSNLAMPSVELNLANGAGWMFFLVL